jgi:hypothetical protein
MAETRYNIDLHEDNKAGKLLRIIFGVACLAASVWYMYSIRGTVSSTGSAWIATAFLLLFGLWMIASGLGYTRKYITIGNDKIILRQEFYRPPLIFSSTSLKAVEFRPLTIIFHTRTGSISLRLGTYYPEHTATILQAAEEFCKRNNIEIRGDNKTDTGV